ncbi:hypothetical protein CSOJ01_08141 [Colletotrichum sojae]|uniref:Uncharacterized protein n=1 Tax=Colletotrichum sojae TaxID=2175907 RepID=A0A8H6J7C9_9PEZI|nr:hypothetical protein CSOJ01_08141 [Colletotrichum sojae]
MSGVDSVSVFSPEFCLVLGPAPKTERVITSCSSVTPANSEWAAVCSSPFLPTSSTGDAVRWGTGREMQNRLDHHASAVQGPSARLVARGEPPSQSSTFMLRWISKCLHSYIPRARYKRSIGLFAPQVPALLAQRCRRRASLGFLASHPLWWLATDRLQCLLLSRQERQATGRSQGRSLHDAREMQQMTALANQEVVLISFPCFHFSLTGEKDLALPAATLRGIFWAADRGLERQTTQLFRGLL